MPPLPVAAVLALLVLMPFKNLQVLRPATDADLYGAMNFMAGSLGVTCEHCHVNPWDSDARDAKKTARQMMRMVRGLNDTYFEGRPVVTCAACHRGSLKPATRPDLSWAAWAKPPADAPGATVPSADVIVSDYLRAIGMNRSEVASTPRLMDGGFELTDGMRPPRTISVEVALGATGELRVVDRFPNRPSVTIWNGAQGWLQSGERVTDMAADDIADAKRTIETYRGFDPSAVSSLRVAEDRTAPGDVVVLAAVSGGVEQRFWISRTTSLLVRRDWMLPTPLGTIVERAEYSDYRPVGRYRLPFRITLSAFAQRMDFRFDTVRVPADVPASLFARPSGGSNP